MIRPTVKDIDVQANFSFIINWDIPFNGIMGEIAQKEVFSFVTVQLNSKAINVCIIIIQLAFPEIVKVEWYWWEWFLWWLFSSNIKTLHPPVYRWKQCWEKYWTSWHNTVLPPYQLPVHFPLIGELVTKAITTTVNGQTGIDLGAK